MKEKLFFVILIFGNVSFHLHAKDRKSFCCCIRKQLLNVKKTFAVTYESSLRNYYGNS